MRLNMSVLYEPLDITMMQTKQEKVLNVKSEKSMEARFSNENYKTDVEYGIQMNRWLLKPLGLWPMSHEAGNIEKTLARLLILVCTFVLFFVLITGTLYTFVKEKNTTMRLKLIGVLSFCVMAILKYGSLVMSRRDIRGCLEHLVTDWRWVHRAEDRQTMLGYALFGRYGATICTGFMYGGGIFYAGVMPLLTGSIRIPELNITIRPLPYPAYFVFCDPQESPLYELVFATHCCCAFVMHSTATAACSLAVVFVMHACGQLKILRSWLNCLVDNEDNGKNRLGDNADDRLAIIVAQHVRTLSFGSTVFWVISAIGVTKCVKTLSLFVRFSFIFKTEKILRGICLVELVGCTLNLCLLGFDLLTEWEHSGPIAMLTYVILITSFIFNIFLFCYIGEILTEECRKIGEKTYMIDWYRLPGKTALGLTLTIAMAENPATITAGRLMELSLTTFCSVIKTSVAYLNILRTLTA